MGALPKLNSLKLPGGNALGLLVPTAAIAVVYWAILMPAPVYEAGPLSPERTKALADKAKSQLGAENYDGALKTVGELLAHEPDNHIYLRWSGEAHHGLKKWAEEAKDWERFMEVAPLPEEACPQIGKAYQRADRAEDAARAFQKCYEVSPGDPDAMLFLAITREHAGDFARAVDLYTDGLKASPDYLDLRIGLARAQMQLGKLEQATQNIASVLAKEPKNTDALFVAGVSRMRAGDRPGAHKYLDEGAKLSPSNGDFQAALAQLKRAEGGL